MRAYNDTEALLTLWECALGQPAGARDDALLSASFEGAEPARTLGERNARLMELHARLFGREIELLSHCPACHTVAQFSGNCDALAAQMWPRLDDAPPHRLEAQGHVIEFRLPDSADITIASADEGDEGDEDFAQLLLDRCVLACTCEGTDVPVRQLPEPVLDALSQQMETLDPGASVSFALDCPQCATHWQAPLDVGEMLWQKVRAAAERVLLDVDVLARAYGWTEREVLRLSPVGARRICKW
ncbi:hypothetical protein LP416_01885 [Polaromonas sp. P2-4]|nr:hypothetical protein LP416_01885 [Polaromonas sp. P2-4]